LDGESGERLILGLCPKCGRSSVFYDPYFKMARCCYKSCGFSQKVSDEKNYFDSFEKDSEDHKRKIPSYDLSFTLLRRFADVQRINGYLKPMNSFYFFSSIGQYTGESASSLEEFAQKIKRIDVRSLEFHFMRGDFERWISDACGEKELGKKIVAMHEQNPTGENLRNMLQGVISVCHSEGKTRSLIPAE
jgi:hypothetical protein